jgi:hypothetical protein
MRLPTLGLALASVTVGSSSADNFITSGTATSFPPNAVPAVIPQEATKTHTSVTVNWLPPYSPGALVDKYELQYRVDTAESPWVSVPSAVTGMEGSYHSWKTELWGDVTASNPADSRKSAQIAYNHQSVDYTNRTGTGHPDTIPNRTQFGANKQYYLAPTDGRQDYEWTVYASTDGLQQGKAWLNEEQSIQTRAAPTP